MTSGTTVSATVGSVSHIRLSRPEAGNALSLRLADDLLLAIGRVRAAEAGAVVLSGAGSRFCVGGDLREIHAAPDRPGHIAELARRLDTAFRELERLDCVVVAATQGAVAGAGLGLALCADIVISSADATFVAAYAQMGLTPDCGVSHLLPRAIGQQRALDLLLTPRQLGAAEAEQWGIVTRIATDPLAAAEQLARSVAAACPGATGQSKRLVRETWETSRDDSADDEIRTLAAASVAEEAETRMSAFLARAPR